MKRPCRVLTLDVKGTSHFLLRDPDALTMRLRRFYQICESIPMRFGSQLGEDARAYNYSDTLLVTVFDLSLPSKGIVEVARVLVDECRAADMTVRGFLTRGIENLPHPAVGQWSGAEPKPYQFLFGVNTAVVAADVGEHAHLPGTLYVDEDQWRALGMPAGTKYVVDGRGQCFRVESDSRWIQHPPSSERVKIEDSKPLFEFHEIA